MTTIVASARRGVMVADSKITTGDGTWFPSTKIQRLPDGALIGTAGDAATGEQMEAWVRGGKHGKPPKGECIALLLRRGGVFVIDNNGHELRIERGFHAIGSGATAALGALYAGVSPASAVRIACRIDAHSGGRVRAVKL